jgi:O-antigen ligase
MQDLKDLPLVGVVLTPVIMSVTVMWPQILLYYLVLDSWLILRISQISFLHPAVTLNRILVYCGLIVVIVRRLKKGRLVPAATTGVMSVLVTVFILYCFYSYYTYTHTFGLTILNNLVFYFLALMLLDTDFERSFRHICIIAIIPVLLLSLTSIINMIAHMDVGQRSFAGNRIHSSFKTLLGICFLIPFREMVRDKRPLRVGVTLAIIMGVILVSLSLGRMVTFILLVVTLFYFARRYISVKILCAAVAVVLLFLVCQPHLVSTYLRKLVRTPSSGNYEISKYDRNEMAAFTSGRSDAYKAAWEMYLKSPFVGIGYDRWLYLHKGQPGSSLHSRWLQILVETGIPGFALYTALFVFSFVVLIRRILACRRVGSKPHIADALTGAMLCFLFIGLTDNHGFTDRAFYLFLAMTATLQKTGFSQKDSTDSQRDA